MTRLHAEHFCPGVAERAGDDAVNRLVHVGVVIDDDGVLAAQLGEDALDVLLSRPHLGRLPVDVQTDAARAGEGDHGHIGMIDQRRADFLADARQIS